MKDMELEPNTLQSAEIDSAIKPPYNDDFLDDRSEVISHYGTPRHSGRYPWGSGKNPQRNRAFLQRAADLEKQGLSRREVAAAMGLSTGDFTAIKKNYKYQVAMENQAEAIKLRNKGWSQTAIAEKLGVSEGTVRNMLDPNKGQRENRVANVANTLKETLKEKPYLDIGEGVNTQLGISEEHLHSARIMLEDEGYRVHDFRLNQVNNPKQFTNMKILTAPDVTRAEVMEHLSELSSPDGIYFENYGETVRTNKPVTNVSLKRVHVNYAEDGGDLKDGLIEIRPGVEDLTLGGRRYAQVRIAVDGTHYMKGMAVYGDPKKMPEGKDIVYNVHYHKGTPVLGSDSDHTVMKIMKKDPTNPFGASFREWDYTDSKGRTKQSPINIVNDDTDWEGWKKNLSSQFLSKQRPQLAKRQLFQRYTEMNDEFQELKSLTNPTLKRQLLDEFADTCDSAAVHLKAAALPRQGTFAILPVNSLKDNEVYAPAYENGEEVILVRHPHESVTQIPRLIVNNNNREGKRMLGTMASQAIGITAKAANQLSGADYDGDTVLVIPTKGQKLRSENPMPELIDYNPSDWYSRSPDDPICTGKSRDGKKGDGFNKGIQMGMASNLITDMTIKGADSNEIQSAIKHAMCIIDAEKHNLDWKRSERENGIKALKEKYQMTIDDEGKPHFGAATLISRAKGPKEIPERKEKYSKASMTPEELERYEKGEIIYYNTGRTYKDKNGKIKLATEKLENMAYVKDAFELSEGYTIENIYAEHANRMKALANEARKEMRTTGKLELNKTAKKAYDDVIGPNGTLTEKLERAKKEAPKERQAQALATSVMRAKEEANPDLKLKENQDKRKKLAAKELEYARDAVNGFKHEKRYRIELTPREWEAIQAGAISDTQFETVIRYSDKDSLKKLATPRQSTGMKASTRSRALMLLNSGKSPSYVAKELGVSYETLKKEFKNFQGLGVD